MRSLLLAAFSFAFCTRAFPLDPQAPATGRESPPVKATVQEVNDAYVKGILERIRGREEEPAGRVFTNVRLPWFRGVLAKDFLGIMNQGYAKALGVACTHCHVEDDFPSDAKREKRAAREMAAMHRRINQELAKMKDVLGRPEERSINCAACHRGSTDPRDAS